MTSQDKPVVPAEVLLRIMVFEKDAIIIPTHRGDERTQSFDPWKKACSLIELVGWRTVGDERDSIRVSVFDRYDVIGARFQDQKALHALTREAQLNDRVYLAGVKRKGFRCWQAIVYLTPGHHEGHLDWSAGHYKTKKKAKAAAVASAADMAETKEKPPLPHDAPPWLLDAEQVPSPWSA